MPQSTLRFKIRQDGLVEESVEGLVGDSCHRLTASLEEALGSVDNTVPTADSYICSQEQEQTHSLSAEIY